jgi:TPR repeat protein
LDTRFALPANTVLDDSYRIERVVGAGGFGITYEAEDISLGTTVALKEYYPDEFGDRDARMSVRPKSERHKKTFEWGRANFLKEARTLARFEHPSIVRVIRVFEANSTAYMVMGFERGQSFEAWLKALGRPPTQEELDAIVAPLLDALQMMHAADFLHRDIAPDNVIVRADGTPVLLDFGAARRAVAEMSRSLTGIVKAGYSPHEQYSSDSRLQGPWSDLYALGGTLYRAVTGHPPEEATLRVDEDHMPPAAQVERSYRPGFLAAIDACLKVRHSERPRSVAQLRPMLFGPGPRQPSVTEPAVKMPEGPSRSVRTARIAAPSPVRQWALMAAAALAIAGGAYGGYEFMRWQPGGDTVPDTQRKTAADNAKRQAGLDAQRRRLEEERIAAEDAARRKAAAEAEERRKEDERRRIASREEVPAPAAPPRSSEPTQPQGRLIKLPVKLGSQPNDAQKGWLGVEMEPLELPLARSLGRANADGVFLLNPATSGPAAQAGLRYGDIIVGLNEKGVANMDDLRQRVASMAPGGDALVEVWRVAADDGDFLRVLRRLADEGNAESMYRVGRMYAGGVGTTRDETEAVQWYRKGAGAGNSNAEAALAVALLEGHGAALDRQEGVRLLKVAASKDHVQSMYRLSHILLDGKIIDKDTLEATRLLTKASEAGHTPSMVDLGRMYGTGSGVQADPAKALIWFKRATDLGDSGGMAGLGWIYQEGKGVGTDLTKAVMWYRRAADHGNAAAMTDLALLHIQGKGVVRDESAAVALYRKAVSLGNSFAMNNLAWMLQGGRGVPRKAPEEAADLMLKALDRRNEFSHKQMTQTSQAWTKEFRQALQTKLRDVGFFTGRIDGEFRADTMAAINAYINRKH